MFAQSLVEGALLGGLVTWVSQRPAVISQWVRGLDTGTWIVAGIGLVLVLVLFRRR